MISLVTACMNREAHLRSALPHWLRLPGLEEVVIVDWSNDRPLQELTQLDPRVRVIRVQGEPRWVLSYAYNLGIARAAGSVILKCDSDCLPDPGILALAPTAERGFFAGHWKSGQPLGKPSVNGQCVFTRRQFEAVNGYSEFIRTYGRDDEDFYDRLIAAGAARQEINPALLNFLDHSHEARMANQVRPDGEGIAARLQRDVVYNEMKNQFYGRALPWGPARTRAGYRSVASGERWAVLERDVAAELTIPPLVEQAARLFAVRYVTAKILRLAPASVDRLDERACLALLQNRLRIAA